MIAFLTVSGRIFVELVGGASISSAIILDGRGFGNLGNSENQNSS